MRSQGDIICIVGCSGSGKTTIANILEERYGMKSVQSYTTRPQRYEGEQGHIFISPEEVKNFKDIVAYNRYNGYEYFATAQQIDEADVYVVDIPGLLQLKEKYTGPKEIASVGLLISPEEAEQRMLGRGDSPTQVQQRLASDAIEFKDVAKYCDITIGTDLPADTVASMIYGFMTYHGLW